MLTSALFSMAMAGLAAAKTAKLGHHFEFDPEHKPSTGGASHRNGTTRSADCAALVSGLLAEDCQHMNDIGMAGMGDNVLANNGHIWIGNDGANTFTFTNNADPPVPVTLVMWDFPPNDYEASFMNVRTPKVSYSLTNKGDQVTVSLGNDISGGWAALNNRVTTLSQYGQIYNTWGEFTTGAYATVDVSREVNMGGNPMEINTPGGCVANMDMCSFHCKSGNECGDSGTYDLLGCTPDVNPNSATGTYDGINPEGGCQGWSNGGHLDISLM